MSDLIGHNHRQAYNCAQEKGYKNGQRDRIIRQNQKW